MKRTNCCRCPVFQFRPEILIKIRSFSFSISVVSTIYSVVGLRNALRSVKIIRSLFTRRVRSNFAGDFKSFMIFGANWKVFTVLLLLVLFYCLRHNDQHADRNPTVNFVTSEKISQHFRRCDDDGSNARLIFIGLFSRSPKTFFKALVTYKNNAFWYRDNKKYIESY